MFTFRFFVVMLTCLAFGCSNTSGKLQSFFKLQESFFKILDLNKVMFSLASQHWKFKMDWM